MNAEAKVELGRSSQIVGELAILRGAANDVLHSVQELHGRLGSALREEVDTKPVDVDRPLDPLVAVADDIRSIRFVLDEARSVVVDALERLEL